MEVLQTSILFYLYWMLIQSDAGSLGFGFRTSYQGERRKDELLILELGGEYNNALLIEFAENQEKDSINAADDGRLYYKEDYALEEMFDAMMEKIEYELGMSS